MLMESGLRGDCLPGTCKPSRETDNICTSSKMAWFVQISEFYNSKIHRMLASHVKEIETFNIAATYRYSSFCSCDMRYGISPVRLFHEKFLFESMHILGKHTNKILDARNGAHDTMATFELVSN